MNYAHRTPLPPKMDVTDFLGWTGDGTGTRYELVDGVLRAMAPASDAHNTIISRLVVLITRHLDAKRPGCRVVTSPGIQPRVRSEWNFRIPDLGVTCTQNQKGDVMTPDPILLVEVLSPGNATETWDNVMAYTTLPSVQEILIVHSTRIKAELLRRDAQGHWPANPELIEAGALVALASIEAELPLNDVYTGTYLTAKPV
jgi:Uma2 family endonuclease